MINIVFKYIVLFNQILYSKFLKFIVFKYISYLGKFIKKIKYLDNLLLVLVLDNLLINNPNVKHMSFRYNKSY